MNAERDDNNVPTMLGISSVDGVTPVPIEVDPINWALRVEV